MRNGVGERRAWSLQSAVPTVGLLCQMVFPHLRSGQHMAFRSPGMPGTHCVHCVSSDGHHDYFKCKRCHPILFHDLYAHCRQLIHGYQLLT